MKERSWVKAEEKARRALARSARDIEEGKTKSHKPSGWSLKGNPGRFKPSR